MLYAHSSIVIYRDLRGDLQEARDMDQLYAHGIIGPDGQLETLRAST